MNIDWDDIYLRLFAYTHQLLEAHKWFRNGQSDSYLRGKQVEDYVNDAIEEYLTFPNKFDQSKGRSLVNYLKLHIIRRLVSNDANSAENRKGADIFASPAGDDEHEDPFINVESMLPMASAYFDQEIDYKCVMAYILEQLQNDQYALIIFNEVCCNEQKRRDVIREHNLSEKDFDNGMKRLRTVLNKAASNFDLIKRT